MRNVKFNAIADDPSLNQSENNVRSRAKSLLENRTEKIAESLDLLLKMPTRLLERMVFCED